MKSATCYNIYGVYLKIFKGKKIGKAAKQAKFLYARVAQHQEIHLRLSVSRKSKNIIRFHHVTIKINRAVLLVQVFAEYLIESRRRLHSLQSLYFYHTVLRLRMFSEYQFE
jgi:hypothetical protein